MTMSELGYTHQVAADQIVSFRYTNHSGVSAMRRVVPERIWFGSTDWHTDPQWLLEAFDCDRQALRCFAMRDIDGFNPDNSTRVPSGSGASAKAR